MKTLKQGNFVGERALFASSELEIYDSVFADGESPLKESKDIYLAGCIFKWKYPLWYCDRIVVNNTTLLETARSGIWYSHNLKITDTVIEAPKTFRRSTDITLHGVSIPHAQETLWSCERVEINRVNAAGDYFGMNCSDVVASDFVLHGNYAFDGGKNIVVRNSKLISKDAFWNCENVTVYDSLIIGEYLGWNSKNVTFINCTIESDQGLCYMDGVKLVDCKLINTVLAFEYSTVDAEISSYVDSVKNPTGGRITAEGIGEIIMESERVDVTKTQITVKS